MLTFSEIALSFRNEKDNTRIKDIHHVWLYLEARGISRALAADCGLHVMPAADLLAAARRTPHLAAPDTRVAVVFPHHKMGDRATVLDWWSARLVPTAQPLRTVASFADIADAPPPANKMFCPPNEPPHAYLPPVYDWHTLREHQRIYIHESAIKAINGARCGTASVGLNGVWGWGSRKHNIALVEELRDLPWRPLKLQPVIVFDSNAWDNWQVQAAESALAAKLQEITRCPQVLALRVPKTAENENQGFDDYCMRIGVAAATQWLESTGTVVDISPMRQMFLQLNSEVCVVRELGRIAHQPTGDLMTRPVFTDVNYAHFTVEVEDGENTRTLNVPKLWLADPARVEVQSIEYSPGRPRLIRKPDGELPNLNVWHGMGTAPDATAGVEPWLALLGNNVPDKELQEWIIQWCAYPLQNLGAKLSTYLLVFGPAGTGKNLFFKPLHKIYGDNAVIVDTDALRSPFTSLYAQRQFVHADELVRVRGADEDIISQRVKALVTQETIKVNRKGQPEYTIDNHVNLAITSNYWDCVKLDADDRRACVVRWDALLDRRGDQPYWAAYARWADAWGPAALHDYLLNVDLRGFDPTAWAPATPWKEQVKEATMSPMEAWVADLLRAPQDVLPLTGISRAVWTAKELAVLYYNEAETDLRPGKVKALASALRNAGFTQAHGGGLVKRPSTGVPERWWVIQARDATWTGAAVTAHLKQHGL